MQEWLGNNLDPLTYGWLEEEGRFTPAPGYDEVCPPAVMKMMACHCKKDCSSSACGCRKHGIECSEICSCGELICSNRKEDEEEEEMSAIVIDEDEPDNEVDIPLEDDV